MRFPVLLWVITLPTPVAMRCTTPIPHAPHYCIITLPSTVDWKNWYSISICIRHCVQKVSGSDDFKSSLLCSPIYCALEHCPFTYKGNKPEKKYKGCYFWKWQLSGCHFHPLAFIFSQSLTQRDQESQKKVLICILDPSQWLKNRGA